MNQSKTTAGTLEDLFRQSPDAIFFVHADGTIRHVNNAFEKLTGYTGEEVRGRTTEFLYPSEQEYTSVLPARDRASDRPFSATHRQNYVRKDGQLVTGEAVDIPLHDQSGELSGHISIVRDVTNEPRRRSAVSGTEQIFLDALASSHETAWRYDLVAQQIDIAGPIAQSVFESDTPTVQLTLTDWKARLTTESQRRCDALINEIVERGEGQAELVLNTDNNETVIVSDRGRVIKRDSTGRPAVIAGLLTDISAEKALERRYAETDTYLSTALESADLAAWRFDLVENMTRLVGPLTRYLDLESTEDEFTGAYWCSFLHRDDLGNVIRQTLAMAEGRSDSVDLLYRVKDSAGNWRWIRSIGQVTEKSPDGRGLVANGIINDVTDSIELQSRLEAERNRFETIFRQTPAMLQQVDDDGIIKDVSAYWLSHLGYERDEVVGKPTTQFLTKESAIYAEQYAIPDFQRSGRARNIALQFQKKSGGIIDGLMNGYISTIPGTGERLSYCVITDVTQLRRAYRDLERSNRELDRFATIASHDLQEPLRKITAFASLLRTRYSGQFDSDGDRSLNFLTDAAGRMQSLIDDLLEYAQLDSHPLRQEDLSLKTLITDVEERLSDRIKHTGAIIKLSGTDAIHADRFLLLQCLQNLVSNAIKYRSGETPEITISLQESDDGWTLTVKDNGIGFDPKFADQIFEPFRRLHPRGRHEGAGIGLAIVRQAVQRQNGRISVETRPGEGAKFIVNLPKQATEIQAA